MDLEKRRTDLAGLEALALAQGGYFDRADAGGHGIGDDLLHHHVRAERFERLYPGVYRLRIAPLATHDELLRAWVWTNYRGVISHQSGLALWNLSDVLPSRVQLTVPPEFNREPVGLVLHRARLPDDEIVERDGLPVTGPARTIVDAAAAGTGPEQIVLAARQAIERGLVTGEQLLAAARRPRYRHRRTVLPLIERAVRDAAA